MKITLHSTASSSTQHLQRASRAKKAISEGYRVKNANGFTSRPSEAKIGAALTAVVRGGGVNNCLAAYSTVPERAEG